MQVDINKYEIVSKILLGRNLKLIFEYGADTMHRKVLELQDVVGFIDNTDTKRQIKALRLDEEGGSYNIDLSLRLQRREIKTFPEVYIFVDTTCVDFCFRAVAKSIKFKDWTEEDKWLLQ
jgi:hypothetical protein